MRLSCPTQRDNGVDERDPRPEDGLPAGVHPQVAAAEAGQVGSDGGQRRAEELHQQLHREAGPAGGCTGDALEMAQLC